MNDSLIDKIKALTPESHKILPETWANHGYGCAIEDVLEIIRTHKPAPAPGDDVHLIKVGEGDYAPTKTTLTAAAAQMCAYEVGQRAKEIASEIRDNDEHVVRNLIGSMFDAETFEEDFIADFIQCLIEKLRPHLYTREPDEAYKVGYTTGYNAGYKDGRLPAFSLATGEELTKPVSSALQKERDWLFELAVSTDAHRICDNHPDIKFKEQLPRSKAHIEQTLKGMSHVG